VNHATLPPDHFIQMDKVQMLNIEIIVDEEMSFIDDAQEMRAFLLHQAAHSMANEILNCGYYTVHEGKKSDDGIRSLTYSVHVIVDEAERDSIDQQVRKRVEAAVAEERRRCVGVLRSTAKAYVEEMGGWDRGPVSPSKEAIALRAVADLLE
jgi:hypothetical protein